MRPLRLLAAPLLLALAAALPAHAQVLHGRVADAADGSPVAAAQILALDGAGATAASAVSGADGRYELALPSAGAVRLQVSRIGFRTGISPTVQVGEGERMEVDLSLRPEVVQLEAVQAQSRVTPNFHDPRARGFYERMDRGRGKYYTPEQIFRLNRSRTSDLITTYAGISMFNRRVWMGGDRRGCSPYIYIDGHRAPPLPLDDLIAPSAIWGIEIYRHAWEIPNELPRDGNCGVVMIWTAGS
jgi:hypothetical protein